MQKMKRSTFVEALLLGGALSINVHAAEDLKPEQVTDLYLKTFINNDVESAKKLNDYLRPAFDNKDALNIAMLEKMGDTIQENMTEEFMRRGAGKTVPELKPAMADFAKALQGAIRRSQCHAVSSTQAQNEYVENSTIATVQYVCKIPNAKIRKADFDMLEKGKKSDAKKMTRILRDATTELKTAPVNKEVRGQYRLYDSEGKKTYWHSGAPGDLLDPIMEGLQPT